MVAILFSYLFDGQISLQRFVKLISIYLGLIFIGYLISIFRVTDLAQLPTLLKITIIVSAVLILWFFLSQKKVLYTSQSKGFLRWRNFSYIISSWLFYPLLFLVTWFFYHLVTGSPSMDICKNVNLSLISILSLTITFDFLFGGSVGEEIGWRGYALPLLLKSYTPVTASIILGVIWSLWHLPIDLLAGFGVQGVTGIILRCLTVCPMSVIITWFYLHSKYGMMTSLLLHSGINIIPAFGFSNYEVVFGILIILQMIIVFMILLSDKKIWERHYN